MPRDESPEPAAVKARIAALTREERAAQRPWLLATYDVQGYPQRRMSGRSSPE